jgi:DNA-binding response OmpR family regulator
MYSMKFLTLLVVDDEQSVRETLRAGFEGEGWTVLEASDSATAIKLLEHHPVDLITLDLFLRDEDGFVLAAELRARRNIPVLIISGGGQPFDRVKGLELGADDYVVKPFHIREVILRVNRILDNYRNAVEVDVVAFDNFQFDMRRRQVTDGNGALVDLTGMELDLLELFVRHPGRVLTRDDISHALFEREWSPHDRTIDGHIARLRRKIEPPGDAPSLIRSVRGIGYAFSTDVSLRHGRRRSS